jgi:hypothetical protein
MSKKNKRQIRGVAAQAGSGVSTLNGGSRPLRDEFNPDYTYILRDLRRIGILAASLLVILIGLSFLMPFLMK